MKSREAQAFLLAVGVALLATPAWAQKKYVGFYDFDALGYDAVRATIEVVPATVSTRVAAWCGIDDGRFPVPDLWIQSGWFRNAGDAFARHYYEFRMENASWVRIPIGTAITGEFEVVREYGLVMVKFNGGVQAVLNWGGFDHHLMCKAQYGAEVHGDPDDHVPGTPSDNCYFSNISTRRIGGGYSTASLENSVQLDKPGLFASCADDFESLGAFFVWDRRTLSAMDCP